MTLDKNKIMLAMARCCMSTGEFVKAAGIPEATVMRAMRGKTVRPGTAGKLAKALNVDVEYLMADKG